MSAFGKSLIRSAKNYTRGYTEVQIRVRSATSNNTLGPNGSLMAQIAEATYDPQKVIEILDIVHKRLNDSGKNWRHVFKSLLLLDYLLRTGSEKVVSYAQSNKYIIKTLRYFEYIDEYRRDQGANVRQKSKDITDLLEDKDRLYKERKQYRKIKALGSSDYKFSDSGSLPQTLEDRELSRAIDESKRTYILDQKNRQRNGHRSTSNDDDTNDNGGASSRVDSDTVSDLIESEKDFTKKLQKQEKEQLELYQKIIAERDSLMREHQSAQDVYYPPQDLNNTALYPSEFNFAQNATSLRQNETPIIQDYHQLTPNFLSLQHRPFHSQFQSNPLNTTTSPLLPPSFDWRQILPPMTTQSNFSSQLQPQTTQIDTASQPPLLSSQLLASATPHHIMNNNEKDTFIDPFESLAKKAQESLGENYLQTSDPYLNQQYKLLKSSKDSLVAGSSSMISSNPLYIPSIQNTFDQNQNALYSASASTSAQSLVNTALDDTTFLKSQNMHIQPHGASNLTSLTHPMLGSLAQSSSLVNASIPPQYETFSRDITATNPPLSFDNNFLPPTTFPNILPTNTTATSNLVSNLIDTTDPTAIIQNPPQTSFFGNFPITSSANDTNPTMISTQPSSRIVPSMNILQHSGIPYNNPQSNFSIPELKDSLANNVLQNPIKENKPPNFHQSTYGMLPNIHQTVQPNLIVHQPISSLNYDNGLISSGANITKQQGTSLSFHNTTPLTSPSFYHPCNSGTNNHT